MSEWKNVQLQHANIQLIDGDRGTNYPNVDDFSDSGYCLFLNAKNVTKNGFKFDDCMFIDEYKDKSLGGGKLNRNDIIITTRGTVGNIAYYDLSIMQKNIRINSGMAILRNLNTGLDHLYLKYYFISADFLQQMDRVVFGSAQPQLTIKTINSFVIHFPTSLTEQRKIARILSTVDAVIEKTEAAIAKYKAIKSGMTRDLFTRGIDLKTGKLRPRYEEAPELYKQSELGWVPKEWEVVRMGDVSAITTGDKDTQDSIKDGQYPFFVRSQTIERINSYSYDGEAILTAGDGVGTGKIYHYINGKFDFHQRVYMLYNFEASIVGKYLFYYFKDHFIDRVAMFSAKNTVDSIRRHMISEMLTPKPHKNEQIAISQKLSILDGVIDSNESHLQKHQQLKSALMSDLLTGKVRVKYNENDNVEAM